MGKKSRVRLVSKPKQVVISISAAAGLTVLGGALWYSHMLQWRSNYCFVRAEQLPSPDGNHVALLTDETCDQTIWTVAIKNNSETSETGKKVYVSLGHPVVSWRNNTNLVIRIGGPIVPAKSDHSAGDINVTYIVDRKLEEKSFQQEQLDFEQKIRNDIAHHVSTFTGNADEDQKALDQMMNRIWRNYQRFSRWRIANAEFSPA